MLDADDELTPNSIEARVLAANEYIGATGVKPQLVYGDHLDTKFARLRGYAFPYLCKELSLCQTSTIMLGRECIAYLPVLKINNSDDRIVLAVGERFHVLHSGAAVAIYHNHSSPTRLTNKAKNVFEGVYKIVRDYQVHIIREQGVKRLLWWWLRILRAGVRYQIIVAGAKITPSHIFVGRVKRFVLRIYRKLLTYVGAVLDSLIKKQFDYDFY